jgi:hypothetical protein
LPPTNYDDSREDDRAVVTCMGWSDQAPKGLQ